MLDVTSLEDALAALGAVLTSRGLSYELVAIGGSSLMLLGLIRRPTRDLDIVALVEGGHYVKPQPLPQELLEAARDVGEALGIGDGWINAGPADLLDFGLPVGFGQRVETRHYGGLTLHLASRRDQVFLKLYAATDQGPSSKHFQDLQALDPTQDELITAARWAMTHDPSEGFRMMVLSAVRTLGVSDAESLL